MYNAAVEAKLKNVKRLSSIVPTKGEVTDYNYQITAAFKDVKLKLGYNNFF